MGNCGERFLILLDIDKVFNTGELLLTKGAEEETAEAI